MAITRTPEKLSLNSVNVALTNLAAAETEFAGNAHRRVRVTLTDADRCRLTARVSTAGSASSVVKAQYSTNGGETTWADLTPAVPLNVVGTVGGAWGNVPAGAKGDVVLRLVTVGGDGVADPVVGSVVLEVQ